MSGKNEIDPETDPNRQLYPNVGWGRSPKDVQDDREKQRDNDKKEK